MPDLGPGCCNTPWAAPSSAFLHASGVSPSTLTQPQTTPTGVTHFSPQPRASLGTQLSSAPLGLPGRRATGEKETSPTSNQVCRRVWGDARRPVYSSCHTGHGNTEQTCHTLAMGRGSAQVSILQSRTQHVMCKAFWAMFCSPLYIWSPLKSHKSSICPVGRPRATPNSSGQPGKSPVVSF